jgi:outer membrane lipoprotein-sorting protein
MTARFMLSMILPVFFAAAATMQTARAETLPELLTRMDQSAEGFSTMTGNLKQLDHTEILGENEQQTATVKLKRVKAGLLGRVEFAEPNRRTVALHDRVVEVYYPKSNTVQITDVGKFGQQLDQFLLLGFGTSGKELQKNYRVKLIGTESVGDRSATHIELTPRTKEALEYFKTAELWIAQGSATYPVQEKIHKNAQDYTLITYTDVKLNSPLSDKELELKLPPGVKKIYPQK